MGRIGQARSAGAAGRIDLQTHTTASDGTLSPAALVELAAREGLDVLAITDHDTTDGVREATEAGMRRGVRVVAGIELSATHDRKPVHVLGLFCDPDDATLASALEQLRADREVRIAQMVERLRSLGYDVSMDDVRAQASGRVLARPHVARALVARGIVPSVSAAFTPDLIADGGRADVPRRELSPADAVRMLRVPVLAHPGHIEGRDALIRDLASRGLRGVEVDHPDHPPEMRDELRATARSLDLVATGGSDFHEPGTRRLGQCTTSPEAFARLEEIASGA